MRAAVALFCLATGCRSRGVERWATAAGSLSSTALRAHVDFLTDDLLEGRRAGSRGEAVAARYVASELESLGLSVERVSVALPLGELRQGTLEATRGNVRVELRPGEDFVLLGAPREPEIDLTDPPLQLLGLEEWLHTGPAHAAGWLLATPGGRLQIAASPAAATQLGGARTRLRARLELAEATATDVVARLPGAGACQVALTAHHDGFGPGFAGAADGAAGVALLLELARGLSRAPGRPRCQITLRSYGAAEWGLGVHSAPPVPPSLAARAHTRRDRIARDWDWEDLKRRAQQALLRAGQGERP